jgi:hypothetical protein
LHAAIPEQTLQVPAAHDADADEADVDTAIGAGALAFLGSNVRVEDEWRREADCGRAEELATLHFSSVHGKNRLSWIVLLMNLDRNAAADAMPQKSWRFARTSSGGYDGKSCPSASPIYV